MQLMVLNCFQKRFNTMANYDVWTVKQFLEHELEAVRKLNEKHPNKMYEVVIEYLEKRLSGEIQ